MRTKKDFDHQNEYNKSKYDRYSLMLDKGDKEILQQIADKQGVKLNTFIKQAIKHYIKHLENQEATKGKDEE